MQMAAIVQRMQAAAADSERGGRHQAQMAAIVQRMQAAAADSEHGGSDQGKSAVQADPQPIDVCPVTPSPDTLAQPPRSWPPGTGDDAVARGGGVDSHDLAFSCDQQATSAQIDAAPFVPADEFEQMLSSESPDGGIALRAIHSVADMFDGTTPRASVAPFTTERVETVESAVPATTERVETVEPAAPVTAERVETVELVAPVTAERVETVEAAIELLSSPLTCTAPGCIAELHAAFMPGSGWVMVEGAWLCPACTPPFSDEDIHGFRESLGVIGEHNAEIWHDCGRALGTEPGGGFVSHDERKAARGRVTAAWLARQRTKELR
jgi:hypothetical protein